MKDAIQLPKRDIVLMVGWYFLCLTGLMGNIANVAHGVGLGIGLICSLVVFKLKQGHRAERVGTLKTIGLGSLFCISSFFIEAFKSSFF
jgi:GlpG protein